MVTVVTKTILKTKDDIYNYELNLQEKINELNIFSIRIELYRYKQCNVIKDIKTDVVQIKLYSTGLSFDKSYHKEYKYIEKSDVFGVNLKEVKFYNIQRIIKMLKEEQWNNNILMKLKETHDKAEGLIILKGNTL